MGEFEKICEETDTRGYIIRSEFQDSLKSFIKDSLLQVQKMERDRLREMIEGKLILDSADTFFKKAISGEYVEGQVDGYNMALNSVLTEIDKGL